MIMGIADDQMAVAIDAEPARPAIAEIGRRPGRAEIMTIGVVHLNPRGKVHNVEMIVGIDGDGSRPDDVARLQSPAAPDELRSVASPLAADDGRDNRQGQQLAQIPSGSRQTSGTLANSATGMTDRTHAGASGDGVPSTYQRRQPLTTGRPARPV